MRYRFVINSIVENVTKDLLEQLTTVSKCYVVKFTVLQPSYHLFFLHAFSEMYCVSKVLTLVFMAMYEPM